MGAEPLIGNNNLDNIQTTLTVVGLVPGVGEFADVANAAISLARGDYGDAALNLATAIPVLGTLAVGAKVTNTVIKEAKVVNAVEEAGKAAQEIKVIGRLQDTAVARDWKGHDVLNIPDWTIKKNDAWVIEGIGNKQEFYTASPITKQNLWDNIANRETVYGRELRMIEEAGYVQKGDSYIHPDNIW